MYANTVSCAALLGSTDSSLVLALRRTVYTPADRVDGSVQETVEAVAVGDRHWATTAPACTHAHTHTHRHRHRQKQ